MIQKTNRNLNQSTLWAYLDKNYCNQLPNTTKAMAKHPDLIGIKYCTKSEPEMSEEEYKKAIEDLAIKDAQNQKIDKKAYRALHNSYVSGVSPDRRSLISKALKAFGQIVNGQLGQLLICDNSGNSIAFYDESGWSMVSTSAESARSQSFTRIYNLAYNSALPNNTDEKLNLSI